jgi:hypothetical protein
LASLCVAIIGLFNSSAFQPFNFRARIADLRLEGRAFLREDFFSTKILLS